MFPSRSRAAASVLAGEVLLLPERRRAEKPGQLVPEDVELEVADAPAVRLAGWDQAGQRARRVRARRGGPRARSTSAPPRAASPTACSSAAPRTSWRSTSPTGSWTGSCARDERVTVIERTQRPCADAGDAALPARPDRRSTCRSSRSPRSSPPCSRAPPSASTAWRWSSRSSRSAAARWARAGSCASRALRRGALVAVGRAAHRARRRRPRLRRLRAAGAQGQPGDVRVARRGGRGGAVDRHRGRRRARSSREDAVNPHVATVFTHRRPAETGPALDDAAASSPRRPGSRCASTPRRPGSTGLARPGVSSCDAPMVPDVDICFALGGDGTILTALRRYAGTGVPVFGINFGEIGFLATVDREEAGPASQRAFAGDFEVLSLPAIAIVGRRRTLAGDQRHLDPPPAGKRVADLEYAVGGDEVGRVRCDGLVVATPAGLHRLQPGQRRPRHGLGRAGLRRLVHRAALADRPGARRRPRRRARVHNRSQEEPVDVTVDGRPIVHPGARRAGRGPVRRSTRARWPRCAGTTFYQRLREKFGRMAIGALAVRSHPGP